MKYGSENGIKFFPGWIFHSLIASVLIEGSLKHASASFSSFSDHIALHKLTPSLKVWRFGAMLFYVHILSYLLKLNQNLILFWFSQNSAKQIWMKFDFQAHSIQEATYLHYKVFHMSFHFILVFQHSCVNCWTCPGSEVTETTAASSKDR